MKVKQVAALPEGLEVTDIEVIDEVLTITAVSTQLSPCCPLCGTPARRVHSHYTRQITDLPCSGQQVRLLVQVRKCFCEVPDCARKIFVERLTPFVEPWARVTRRLYQIVQILGLATGGRLGIRVTDRLGIQTSRLTILRRIMALPTEPVGQVSELGIDDFSFRRGRKFGTILVDMQSHKTIDLLPDRTKESAAAWMSAHPEIDLVSRDRGGDYAAGAREGAPQATQIADRFHLSVRRIGARFDSFRRKEGLRATDP
jgi:transposase